MIDVKNVSKIYRSGDRELKAVDAVDITIRQGEFTMIVGRSGSGKSTLLGIMGGLIKPTTGEVVLGDKALGSLTDAELARLRSGDIGFVFQFSGLLSTLTALENVTLPAMFTGEGRKAEEKGKKLMEKLGLADKFDSYPNQLSGGEMKRVAIARALMNDPGVLLADEPTGDLDASTEIEIMDYLKEINHDGKTIVLVTHNPELSRYATSLYRMEKGCLENLTKEGGGSRT